MGLTRGTVDDACAWYRAIAMHGMHGEEQSQEQVDQKGVLQSTTPGEEHDKEPADQRVSNDQDEIISME